MKDSILLALLLQLLLIILNAIFACTEIAVISMNDNRLAKLAAEGNRRAIRLARLTSQPARFLATIQVAITLSGFLGSAFAADNFAGRLADWVVSLGSTIPRNTLNSIAVILITLILSFFTLVLGELVPKRLAMKNAESIALRVSGLITFISKLFAPLVALLTVSTNGVLRLLGVDPNAEDESVSEEEIRMMVDVGSEKGVIDVEEKTMIQNIFEFDDLNVGEFATHRTEMTLLWADETPEQWEITIRESRHSLYPVCSETADNIIGILNSKDYFRLTDKSRESVMENAVKPAFFVPESLRADVLFRKMKQSRNHFAVVLDEYGGVFGIVTMYDLLEQIVGDIDDDTSPYADPPEIMKIDTDTWQIHGNAPLDDVGEKLGVSLPTDEYDTFGGMVFGQHAAIPDDGSQFEIDIADLHIRVAEIKDHRIEKSFVTIVSREEESGDGAAEPEK